MVNFMHSLVPLDSTSHSCIPNYRKAKDRGISKLAEFADQSDDPEGINGIGIEEMSMQILRIGKR